VHILASRPDPALVRLPWDTPLEQWVDHVVPVPRGLSRHVVRVIGIEGRFYAVKETEAGRARWEYDVLRRLRRRDLPVVEAQAVVEDRPGDLPAALVTRHLAWSLPYRTVFATGLPAEGLPRLVDALVVLLVRLHLAGFYWGDMSLSNVLFRRSAGEFAAYLVDAETGELHDSVSAELREHDVAAGCENVFGEVLDLQADGLVPDVDPHALVDHIDERYRSLWTGLLEPEEFSATEMWRIERRIDQLNALGFDVDELDISTSASGSTVRIQPRVVEAGHHSRELEELTGLALEENQARRLLNDLARFTAHLDPADRPRAAERWRADIFDRLAATIPERYRGRLEPAEVFHEVLEHRWLMSERAGREVDLFDALDDYLATQLPYRPETRLAATPPDLRSRRWPSGQE